ncbi:MAG: sterol carrier family protein [Actinomycetota bacterium]|nr:sterol carrier family protein [Actinomycetota bacterium]
MARARIPAQTGVAAVRSGSDPATASRYLLQVLADVAPGNTVEVRVPPYGAAQVVEGPRHTRGTPPNVIEMDAATWIGVATGAIGWNEAVADARITASGQRASLREWLPLPWETMGR